MLNPGWKVKGGWKNWFLAIASTVMQVLATVLKWFMPNLAFPELDMKSDLENRLYEYFLKHGYDSTAASSTANDIAKGIVDG